MTSVPVQFFYRYLMIVRRIEITVSQNVAMLFLAFIGALFYYLLAVFVFWPGPNAHSYEPMAALLRQDPIYGENLPIFVVASIDEWRLRTLFSYAYFLTIVTYAIIIFASFSVWRYLKNMENEITIQIQDSNHQITRTLFIQAFIPCVICLVPVAVVVTVTVFHGNVPGLTSGLIWIWSIIPVANPTCTILSINNYKKCVIKAGFHVYHRIRKLLNKSYEFPMANPNTTSSANKLAAK
uniref:Uncharacterized protein n=1 Tax=Panagrolaimus sp. JU765 TaxID=591449 RepID=A0AC34QWH9_9BILA